MAYTRVNWKNFPSTNTPRNATNLNVMDAGLFNQDARITVNENEIDNLQTGWNSAGETWTYSSVDNPTGVITISGDKTSKYSLGMRIKFTNATNIIYGIITKISYSSPKTTLTFLHEINPSTSTALHLMANSTITNNYYSSMKAPFGFPIDCNKWSVIMNDIIDRTQSSPTANTWYNLNNNKLDVPIGMWDLSYELFLVTTGNQGSFTITGYSTLSTTNNSQSDASMTYPTFTCTSNAGVEGVISANAIKTKKCISLLTKTSYYLNLRTTVTVSQIQELGSYVTTSIKAVCAYL